MFIVTIENDGVALEIHGDSEKLKSGKVVKGINAIDSFSFSLLPSNVGFNAINDFTTLVKVYNTNKDRYEFFGRVLYSDTTMAESGLITKDVTCESYFGFFCDSQQTVVGEKNWTVTGLLQTIIDQHNSQVEEYKRFTIGTVTVSDPNDNLYKGIQYENTWDTLKDKFIDTLGGEFQLRVENGVNYIDYLTEIGKTSETEIAISRNMKSIKQERDPSAYITRLIPLGMKMGENDERLTIEEVNGGLNYIDDAEGIEKYGIHVGYQTWDDVTEASNLFTKAKAWLQDNNKLKVKYSVTALDLSLLGLDIDDFDIGNWHPLINPLLGIDDNARITKKSIDVCEEVKSTIEIGENFKTASDIQIEQQQQAKKTYSLITKENEKIQMEVKNEMEQLSASFTETVEGFSLSVVNGETSSTIKLLSGETEINSAVIKMTGVVTFSGLADGTTTIDGSCIKTGTISADRIDVENLNLTGVISFSQLSDYSTVNARITAAENNGGLSEDEVTTLITSELVSSPKIMGGAFYDAEGVGKLTLSYNSRAWLTFEGNSSGREMFSVGGTDYGGTNDVTVMTFADTTILQHYASTGAITLCNVTFSSGVLSHIAENISVAAVFG